MATLRHITGLAVLALITACYQPAPELYSTFPEPTEVAGPPGGEIDPAWQSGYVDDNASTADGDASTAAEASGELVGACTDDEITETLSPYGEWIYIEGYGEVWRPYPTVVGVDFTPYETCGTWVWTEWGWTFACEWDWGWLPFHYGRWGWFDDFWAWVPGYEWSPAWVEWRGGGGYVGWRPLAPVVRDHRTGHKGPIVRDHRTGKRGPIVRDHRDGRGSGPRVRDHRRIASQKQWQWRFVAERDLGKPRIRSHLYKGLAEGLRVTKVVAQPTVRPKVQPVAVASIMRPRLSFAAHAARDNRLPPVRARGRVEAGPVRVAPAGERVRGDHDRRPLDRSSRAVTTSVYQPTWQRSHAPRTSLGAAPAAAAVPVQERAPTTTPTAPTPPTPPVAPTIPDRHLPATTPPAPPTHVPDRITSPQPPVVQPPTRAPDRYTPRPPVYQPPTRVPDRVLPPQPPIYQPPTRAPERYTPPPTYSPPTRAPERYTPPPTYSPPARDSSPSYSPPTRSYSPPTSSPPARSYSPPTYSPPVRSAPVSAPRSHRR